MAIFFKGNANCSYLNISFLTSRFEENNSTFISKNREELLSEDLEKRIKQYINTNKNETKGISQTNSQLLMQTSNNRNKKSLLYNCIT